MLDLISLPLDQLLPSSAARLHSNIAGKHSRWRPDGGELAHYYGWSVSEALSRVTDELFLMFQEENTEDANHSIAEYWCRTRGIKQHVISF